MSWSEFLGFTSTEQSKVMEMKLPRIIVVGGGLGGTVAAYELAPILKDRAELMLISDRPQFSFTPSNPWVAVRWRVPEAIQVDLEPVMARKEIQFSSVGVKRVHPEENRVELNDGSSLDYDYLVIATGPELAFDEVEGLGPERYTRSRFARPITPMLQRRPSIGYWPIPARSSSARPPARPASAPLTSSR